MVSSMSSGPHVRVRDDLLLIRRTTEDGNEKKCACKQNANVNLRPNGEQPLTFRIFAVQFLTLVKHGAHHRRLCMRIT